MWRRRLSRCVQPGGRGLGGGFIALAIVVGVDGSPESKDALRWARAEAKLQQTPLRAVWVWQLPVEVGPTVGPLMGTAMYDAIGGETAEELRHVTERHLEAVIAEVARDMPEAGGVRVEQEAIEGHAAEMLVRAADDEELLVVGSRGRGGFKGLLLGSVS